MTFRIATPEQLEAAKVPADLEDFADWVRTQRQEQHGCRTEYQKRKTESWPPELEASFLRVIQDTPTPATPEPESNDE